MKPHSFTVRAAALVVAILASALWPGKQALAQDDSSWETRTLVYVGQLNRGSTGTLAKDNGATIDPGNLLFLDNDELMVLYGLDLIHRWVFGESVWDIRFGFSFGDSDGDQLIDRVSPGAGNNLQVLSPVGEGGGLGGGFFTANDAVNIRHTNDNEFHEFRLGFGRFFPLGPRWGVRAGPLFSYGQWDLTETLHGSIDGLNQTFAYHNMAEITTYSIGAGLDVEHDVGTVFGTPVEYYGGVSFERQFHDNDGHSTLTVNGIANASERQELGGSDETNRFKAYAGLHFDVAKNVDLVVGGQYRSYSTPEVKILPQQVAYINLGDADELTGYVRVHIGWGPPVHESPILGRNSDRRLKRDIAHLATLDNGIRLYSFKYLWDDQVHIGVMAQDLLAKEAFRDAVVMRPNGFYAVDYGKLGLKMATIEAWREYGLAAVMLRPAASRVGSLEAARVN